MDTTARKRIWRIETLEAARGWMSTAMSALADGRFGVALELAERARTTVESLGLTIDLSVPLAQLLAV